MRSVVTFHYTLRDPSGRGARHLGRSHTRDLSGGRGADHRSDSTEQLRGAAAGLKMRGRRVLRPRLMAAPRPGAGAAGETQSVARGWRADERSATSFQGRPRDRFAPTVTVVSIDGDGLVLLDANHPFAGVELTFDVEILSTRAATPGELRHGHAHGADGSCAHSASRDRRRGVLAIDPGAAGVDFSFLFNSI